VENTILDPEVQELHLPFYQFEKQIEYLRKNFEIISIDDLYDCLKNGYKIDSSQVLITFDDGYSNNFHVVMPYLNSIDVPFSVFVCTNHIDKGQRFPTYYLRAAVTHAEKSHITLPSLEKSFDINDQAGRHFAKRTIEKYLKTAPQDLVNQIVNDLKELISEERWTELNEIFSSDELMDWKEIRELSRSGVTVGSHCHDHFIMHPQQDKKEADYQLSISKELITKNLGKCQYFAFPDGSMDNIRSDSLAIIKENNYSLGFTAVSGEIINSSNPFLLPRMTISNHLDHFKFKLSTSFRFNRQFRRWGKKFS
jgi:peptidoglycan/xylan/chitin deacetylase (PgdA/CDA1 family)